MSQLKTMVTAVAVARPWEWKKDHAGEGEQVEEELHPSRITEAQQLAHHLAIVAWQSHSNSLRLVGAR